MVAMIGSDVDQQVDGLVAAARVARAELAATSDEVDARGEYPRANIERLTELGLLRLWMPVRYGGLVPDDAPGTWKAAARTEIQTEIAAGESSTAQIWTVHAGLVRSLLTGKHDLPDATRDQLAHEVLNEGARFISSAAEPQKKRLSFQTTGTRAPGGLVVNGTKYFGTGADGARYGNVPLLLDGFPSVEEGGLYFAIVRLDSPGVTVHHDWDNMGQRATSSQAVTYDNVFVPDGFHYGLIGGGSSFYQESNITGPSGQINMTATILGMGLGALDATLDYVRQYTRPVNPEWPDATVDPVVRWQVGRHSAYLTAARAAVREAAAALEAYGGDPNERARISVQVMQAKVVTLDAVLAMAGDVHRLAGGRATANKYRLDRFWRNARTLSVHDSIDSKLQMIGAFELSGIAPPVNWLS